jgi:hypothetical protein
MDKDYAVIHRGTPIRIMATARGANKMTSRLEKVGLVVERVEPEFTVSMLRREAEAIGIHVQEDMPSISNLMKELVAVPVGDDRYWEILNEIVFWIPFVSRHSWKEMALAHLERLGWEDESIPSYPTVPETLYRRR